MNNKILTILSRSRGNATTLQVLIFLLFVTTGLFAKVNIVATLPDYASMAKELGGDKVKVMSLTKGTQDPHFVDAKPSFIIKMNKADLLILTGLGLESGWLPKLITNSRNSKITLGNTGYLDASKYVNLLESEKEIDRSMGDVHPGGNPHFYTSPKELFKVAKEIYNRLIKLDSDNKDYYDKNWKSFNIKYIKKLKEWENKLAKVKGMQIIEYHESWIYLLKWANIVHVGALEPKPGVSPSTKHIIKLLKKVKKNKIKYLIQEVYYPKKLSKLFVKKSKSKLLVLPSAVGALKNTNSIWTKFDYIVNNLTK